MKRDRTIDERITPRQLRRVWDMPVILYIQAKAEAKSRAEAARIEAESAVDGARLKAEALKIETEAELGRQNNLLFRNLYINGKILEISYDIYCKWK